MAKKVVKNGFVRVRSAGRGDPKHEYDISAALLDAHPERYKVVDSEPVDAARPAVVVAPEKAAE
jgi:hypothetical protein